MAVCKSGPIPVKPGETLIGVIEKIGETVFDGTPLFGYRCLFEGRPNGIRVHNVPELVLFFETLEAYGIQACTDYPRSNPTRMSSIAIQTAAGTPAVTWSPFDNVTDCGQHVSIVSNSATDGEVDIFYR